MRRLLPFRCTQDGAISLYAGWCHFIVRRLLPLHYTQVAVISLYAGCCHSLRKFVFSTSLVFSSDAGTRSY